MHFLSVDVETANPFMGSICQIGIARFVDGEMVEEWSSLVNPESDFDGFNVSIHGITPQMVVGKPKMPEVAEKIRSLLESGVAVSHTPFDRRALSQAFNFYGLTPVVTQWLDSSRVARTTWKELSKSGYGLANICSRIGYMFKHHDALEDAKAAGYVLLAALQESSLGLDEWLKRVEQPINPERSSDGASVQRIGNPEGELFGQVIVFTGALEMVRCDAADLAASVGCQVGQKVNKKTTILVVGDQDASKLAGYDKSSKHREAEQLASMGYPIRIILENDFKALLNSHH